MKSSIRWSWCQCWTSAKRQLQSVVVNRSVARTAIVVSPRARACAMPWVQPVAWRAMFETAAVTKAVPSLMPLAWSDITKSSVI